MRFKEGPRFLVPALFGLVVVVVQLRADLLDELVPVVLEVTVELVHPALVHYPDLALLVVQNLAADVSVVRDEDDAAFKLVQGVSQRVDGLHVEVVRGLVHQKQPGLLQQDLTQGDAHLPAAGEGRDEPVVVLGDESELGHDLVDGAFHVEEVEPVRLLLQLVQLLEEDGHEIHVGLVLQRLLDALGVLDHDALLAKRAHEFFADGVGFLNLKLLGEVADLDLVREHDLALVSLHLTHDDPQLGGLTGAVPAHEADLLALLAVPRASTEHLHALERFLQALQPHAGGHRAAGSSLGGFGILGEDVAQVDGDGVTVVHLLVRGGPVDRRELLLLEAPLLLLGGFDGRLGRLLERGIVDLLDLLLDIGLSLGSGGGGDGGCSGGVRLSLGLGSLSLGLGLGSDNGLGLSLCSGLGLGLGTQPCEVGAPYRRHRPVTPSK
mmetsp:Transcript_9547/g.43262  ORF Transcript_9547/g.43262 Transcript_9547/m.43262 type:complete len:437 (+) Transcript_9547:729-2039(+)